MESGLSASDIALLGNDNGFGGGNALIWIFALLILAGGGFGGFGNNGTRVGEQYSTQADIQRAVDFDTLKQSISGVNETVITNGANVIGAVKDTAYNNLGEIRDLQTQINTLGTTMQNCCCETKSMIMENRYLDSQNTASINANTTAQVQKVLDAISTNRMADMQNQINQLQLANAVSGVVRYPMSTTYTTGTNPYCGCSGNMI